MNKKNEKGASLIELMLAIVIFVVSSASIGHLFIGAQNSANYSIDKMRAILLAKEGIETERAARDDSFSNLSPGTTTTTITLNQKDFQRTVDVTCPSQYICEVQSTVEWTSGQTEQVSLVTHLTGWDEGVYAK